MNWFRRFMIGRYGMDQLSNAMLVLSIILLVISLLFGSGIINSLAMAVLILCYARMFSKNIDKRRQENMKFMKWWYPKSVKLNQYMNRLKSSKTYRYYKCPKCGQSLRVPKGKGRIIITCPKCHNEFSKTT